MRRLFSKFLLAAAVCAVVTNAPAFAAPAADTSPSGTAAGAATALVETPLDMAGAVVAAPFNAAGAAVTPRSDAAQGHVTLDARCGVIQDPYGRNGRYTSVCLH